MRARERGQPRLALLELVLLALGLPAQPLLLGAHGLGGEVGVHAAAVPVAGDGLGVQGQVHIVELHTGEGWGRVGAMVGERAGCLGGAPPPRSPTAARTAAT